MNSRTFRWLFHERASLCCASRNEICLPSGLGFVTVEWPAGRATRFSEPIQLTVRLLCKFNVIMMKSQKYFLCKKSLPYEVHSTDVLCSVIFRERGKIVTTVECDLTLHCNVLKTNIVVNYI